MRPLLGCVVLMHAWLAATSISPMTFSSLVDDPHTTPAFFSRSDSRAFDEMLRGAKGQQQRWSRRPGLTVLGSVMDYRAGDNVRYAATAERLTQNEMNDLVRDLTKGLGTLTAGAFQQFAAVKQVSLAPGELAGVSEPDQIVVGRFNGVRKTLKTIGLGGRQSRADGTITAGAIILDSEYDRTSKKRFLLRTHELGHAIGYNHVESRESIMNPRIGSELNDFDRKVALIAFASPTAAAR